ncbi:N-methyl-L-tryptophan oxidase [Paenibacillus sp. y28]|uniref:N-methyl-L-tryptophan oxidase n=1 Tax=Paenibacillus sp. y28 TaxID=3129110 RepID=UPI0030171D78
MAKGYDVIVAGGGSFGMSAAYYLAKQGANVLVLDAHDPPHDKGSHHGHTRIFRMAYTMGPDYVSLAIRSRQLWEQLEQEAGGLGELVADQGKRPSQPGADRTIFRQTGVVSVGPGGSRFLRSKEESCRTFGIPYERLTPFQLRLRWPGWTVPEGMEGLYEPEAGILFSEAVIRAYRLLALKHGAELLVNTPVHGLQYGPDSVTVHTSGSSYTASRVLLSPGVRLPQLVPELNLPIRTLRKAIGWFEAPAERYEAGVFPAFIVNEGHDVEYYGIPAVDGRGLKVGRHDQGQVLLPDQTALPFGVYQEDEAHLKAFLSTYMPQAKGIVSAGVCKYEMTPDEGFFIGRHPHQPKVWIAGGGSGHGFKFASAIGEALSQAMLFGRSEKSLAAFSIPKR